jgi:uncharacterized membrane protein
MGKVSITALIPLFIGVPILILGVLAFDKQRLKHSMHAASVLIILGLIGCLYRLVHKIIIGNIDESSIILILMSALFIHVVKQIMNWNLR